MKSISLDFKLDKKAISLINIFQKISLIISLFGIIFLYIFLEHFISFDLYEISLITFRTGLLCGVCSFCFGVFFNAINKELIHK